MARADRRGAGEQLSEQTRTPETEARNLLMAKNRGSDPPTPPKGNDRAVGNRGGEPPKGNDNAVGNDGGHGPEGNTNALKHGVRADPANLADHLTDDEQAFVDAFTERYVEIAPFDRDDPRTERLAMAAVKVVQERRGEREIARDGATVERTVGVSEGGTEHTTPDEHHLARFTSRLSKDVRMTLKDLGCLPDPDSEQADATRSLAQVLSDTEGPDEPADE